MKEIRNKKLLPQILNRENIRKNFKELPSDIRLLQYEKGEFLAQPTQKMKKFILIIKGKAKIYAVHEDSRIYSVSMVGEGTILGDMEFCGKNCFPFFIEAAETIQCLVIPFRGNRTQLENDPVFLRYLLKGMSDKMMLSTQMDVLTQTLEEKVLLYMKNTLEGHRIKSVNDALLHLHYSRRQLQRVLKKLCEEGKIEKTGKGQYILKKSRCDS